MSDTPVPEGRTRRVELALAAGFALLGVLVLLEARRIEVAVADSGLVEVLDPADFVALLGWALLAVTAVFAAGVLRASPRREDAPRIEPLTRRPLVPLASMLGFAVLLPWAGFTLATFAFLAAVLALDSRYRLPVALAAAAAITAVLHGLFVAALGVPFPALGRFGI